MTSIKRVISATKFEGVRCITGPQPQITFCNYATPAPGPLFRFPLVSSSTVHQSNCSESNWIGTAKLSADKARKFTKQESSQSKKVHKARKFTKVHKEVCKLNRKCTKDSQQKNSNNAQSTKYQQQTVQCTL